MLRIIIRALAAWASIAVLALLAHAASADTFHSLIEDSFSDPSKVSDRWQVMAGSWSAAHGTYGSTVHATSIATIRQYPVIEPGQPPLPRLLYDVFTFRARMRNPGTGAAQWVGLVYNFQDPQNYHEVVFSPTGMAAVRRVLAGVSTTTAVESYTGGGTGVWFDVAVRRNENLSLTTIEVNGVPLFVNLFHDGFNDGLTGLVTYGVAGRFDKVSLSLPGDGPYRESFDAEIAAAPWSPPWAVENGTYNNGAVEPTSVSLLGAAISPTAATQSYTFRARMFNPYGASGNLVGVVFHGEAARDYTEVVFSPTGVAQINRILGFTKQTLATATYAGRRRTWFDVKFELVALNRVSVSVDGTQLFGNVPTGAKIAGRFGLITHWAPGSFDDVWLDPEVFAPLAETFANPPPSSWVRSGQWDTSGGTLNSTAIGVEDVVATRCGCWNTDFRYSARLLNQFDASGNLVGLVYNYQTSGLYTGDHYEVVFSPTGIARVNKVIQGTRYLVASASHGVPRNVWFDVEVVRSGLSTAVLLNGNTLFDDLTQGELGTGDVGVVTHWSRGRFDDLNVEEYVIR
ncbi:MAG TPA: hypothetical protein VH814_03655 [Steroidobacteraceae bacterium]|jgi:hypothetical protein